MTEQRAHYKITNWKDYNKSLINRGSITIWLSEETLKNWHEIAQEQRKRGRPKYYSDGLIELCLMVKHLYGLPYRATEGFIKSLFMQLKIDVEVPSYSQMSRRAGKLPAKVKRALNRKGPIDIAVDSTGLKVYGEGEWKVRKHGVGKRRTWRKLHLAVDPLDHEIVAATLTDNAHTDEQMLPELIAQIDDDTERCFGDGAYDKKSCYKSCHNEQIQLITPPMRCAQKQKVPIAELSIRDEAIDRIQVLTQETNDIELARAQWKIEADYHCRSISETAMFRFKTIFGDKLSTRTLENQRIEAMVKINLMNRFSNLGMPISEVSYR